MFRKNIRSMISSYQQKLILHLQYKSNSWCIMIKKKPIVRVRIHQKLTSHLKKLIKNKIWLKLTNMWTSHLPKFTNNCKRKKLKKLKGKEMNNGTKTNTADDPNLKEMVSLSTGRTCLPAGVETDLSDHHPFWLDCYFFIYYLQTQKNTKKKPKQNPSNKLST